MESCLTVVALRDVVFLLPGLEQVQSLCSSRIIFCLELLIFVFVFRGSLDINKFIYFTKYTVLYRLYGKYYITDSKNAKGTDNSILVRGTRFK